jgi:hypothetical protein
MFNFLRRKKLVVTPPVPILQAAPNPRLSLGERLSFGLKTDVKTDTRDIVVCLRSGNRPNVVDSKRVQLNKTGLRQLVKDAVFEIADKQEKEFDDDNWVMDTDLDKISKALGNFNLLCKDTNNILEGVSVPTTIAQDVDWDNPSAADKKIANGIRARQHAFPIKL